MPLLTEAAYKATMGTTQRQVGLGEGGVAVDLGAYLRDVDPSDYQGFDFSERLVSYVWSIDDDTWRHVLLAADVPNVFLALVIDGTQKRVHGHYVLDLNAAYGLDD